LASSCGIGMLPPVGKRRTDGMSNRQMQICAGLVLRPRRNQAAAMASCSICRFRYCLAIGGDRSESAYRHTGRQPGQDALHCTALHCRDREAAPSPRASLSSTAGECTKSLVRRHSPRCTIDRLKGCRSPLYLLNSISHIYPVCTDPGNAHRPFFHATVTVSSAAHGPSTLHQRSVPACV
jgi:hypothetical protein